MAESADLAFEIARGVGLTLNFLPNKTEAILAVRGVGADAVRRQLVSTEIEGEVFQIPLSLDRFLRIVPRYRHLGVLSLSNGTIGPEVTNRAQSSRCAEVTLRKTVFRNSSFKVTTKLAVAEGMCQSRLFVAAGSWPPLSAQRLRTLEGAYLQPLLSSTGRSSADLAYTHVAVVLAEMGAVSATDRLAMERLRLAARVASASPISWVPFAAPGMKAWSAQLAADILLLVDVLPDKLQGMPSPLVQPQAWTQLWKAYPQSWRGLLKTFKSRRAKAIANTAALLEPRPPPVCSGVVSCEECSKTFATPRALVAHRAMAHGRRRPINAFDFSEGGTVTTCRFCGVCFRTVNRLGLHLARGAARCVLAARELLPLASVEAEEGRALAERESRKRARRLGLSESAGPPARAH